MALPGEAIGFVEATIRSASSAPNSPCIIWPYGCETSGRPVVGYEGRTQRVCRVICIRVHGEPPTPKHETAHSCGQGHNRCIHPYHLSWKTRTSNQHDRKIHGTASSIVCSSLSDDDVREVKRRLETESQRFLAFEFQVSRATIWRIKHGKRRADV